MRTVLCQDSVPWLAQNREAGSIVTSLPEAFEMELDITGWRTWFIEAAAACLNNVAPKDFVVFYQTDRKYENQIESKAELLFEAARRQSVRTIWHKIVRQKITDHYMRRPSYAHMIAFSREGKAGRPTDDVLHPTRKLYADGMDLEAARVAVQFVGRTTKTVIDPFCGRGTVLAIADEEGLDSIGIDLNPEQAELARAANTQLEMELA